ncbi:Putative NAD-dependent epimerase/dehydratase, NAD(P)-binding domain superfamily [Colletotrichum destructivum]|uniref:NAD-dependent epimerase/dehydratase, NAD(P)-binding domain superfamily n=1 Tax=Colletotrichum destructivum TaxID=34406 RepID=A0AAX4IXU3_9PEZI|nr:Putative NAD-dependent epimerase/dehydratase, NAD(P)-binding domain superfamily [Colletotrichum destructivum]
MSSAKMNILVIGGTGAIGGHAAVYLKSKGHNVTIAGRQPPAEVPVLAELPFLRGNYLNQDDFSLDQLSCFDAVVFAAGSDVRHVPEGKGADDHYLYANGEAIPAFAKRAKQAGVKKFVHVGSAYWHLLPESVASSPYVRSRKLAADGVTGLAGPDFHACSLDPPIVVGTVSGMNSPLFRAYIDYGKGLLPIPVFAPLGGMNFISTKSLSEAVAGALENSHAVSGKAILLGDKTMTYAEYFEMFFRAVGNPQKLPVLDQDHPLLPRATLYGGSKVIDYEPKAEELAALGGYRRDDIENAVAELVL